MTSFPVEMYVISSVSIDFFLSILPSLRLHYLHRCINDAELNLPGCEKTGAREGGGDVLMYINSNLKPSID